jgi:acyl carrier protein
MSKAFDEADIVQFCVRELAAILDLPPERIATNVRLARLGLDSAMSVRLMLGLEEYLGIELAPEEFFQLASVEAIARHLARPAP